MYRDFWQMYTYVKPTPQSKYTTSLRMKVSCPLVVHFFLQFQTITDLSLWLTFSGILYKCKHALCALFGREGGSLGYFIQCDVFEVHSCCSTCQYFVAFYCWRVFHCMVVPHFIYSFTCWWILDYFHVLAFTNTADVAICVDKCFHCSKGLGVEWLGHLEKVYVLLYKKLLNCFPSWLSPKSSCCSISSPTLMLSVFFFFFSAILLSM